MTNKPIAAAACILAFTFAAVNTKSAWAAPMIVDPGQELFTLTISDPAAQQLSGIAHAGGSSYWAVSDSASKLFKLAIDVDPTDGTINSAEVLGVADTIDLTDSGGGALPSGDREGVALVDANTVLISDESGPSIHTHDLTTGNRTDQITTATHADLGVFANIRGNAGWESMARQADGLMTWTANEEALTIDGGTSTPTTGTTVRLQKFDSSMTPVGQWAYVTDPVTGGTGHSNELSGLVDLLAMDDGTLLAMERSVAVTTILGFPAPINFHIRIYAIDFTSATDVSPPFGSVEPTDDGLIGESFTTASKTLLWDKVFTGTTGANFEGLTLGPTLDDGSRSVILVSDNQGLATQWVYPLKLVPEPATMSIVALPMLLVGRRLRD